MFVCSASYICIYVVKKKLYRLRTGVFPPTKTPMLTLKKKNYCRFSRFRSRSPNPGFKRKKNPLRRFSVCIKICFYHVYMYVCVCVCVCVYRVHPMRTWTVVELMMSAMSCALSMPCLVLYRCHVLCVLQPAFSLPHQPLQHYHT